MLRKSLALVFLLFFSLATALVIDFYQFINTPISIEGESILYDVQSGVSLKYVALDLYARGLLRRPFYWRLLAKMQNKADKIKAGQYRLKNSVIPDQLLDLFVEGKTAAYSLTLREGWTYAQVLGAVGAHPQILHTLTQEDDVMTLLGQAGMHPEGWFYPDTYHFPKGTTDIEFLARSHAMMKVRLEKEWASRAEGLPLKTPYEALILASIVEKETALPEERPLIAAVFLSRLKKGMRLQTDPTVIYGLGSRHDGDISYQDLRRDTPYNTYVRHGLTPTPIAVPSGSALHSVLNPAQTNAIYFVSKGDGSHHFSETYDEHRKAVIKYQLSGNASRYRARNNWRNN